MPEHASLREKYGRLVDVAAGLSKPRPLPVESTDLARLLDEAEALRDTRAALACAMARLAICEPLAKLANDYVAGSDGKTDTDALVAGVHRYRAAVDAFDKEESK